MADDTPAPRKRRPPRRAAFPENPFCYLKIKGNKTIGPFPIQDVSKGGATLVLDPQLVRETILAVQLYSRARRYWSEHEVQVEYVFLIPGKFTVGVTFNQQLSDNEVREFQ